MPTSDELIELAERCAEKLEIDGKMRHVPSCACLHTQATSASAVRRTMSMRPSVSS